jgi:hypothetical protein
MVMRTSISRGLSSDPLVSLGGGCIMYFTNGSGSWVTSYNEDEFLDLMLVPIEA